MSRTPICTRIEERLTLYALGDLPSGEAAFVREHAAGCPHCHALLAEIEPTVAGLRDALAPAHAAAPPTLEPQRRHAVRKARDARRARPALPRLLAPASGLAAHGRPWPYLPWLTKAAALLVMLLAVGLLLRGDVRRRRGAVEPAHPARPAAAAAPAGAGALEAAESADLRRERKAQPPAAPRPSLAHRADEAVASAKAEADAKTETTDGLRGLHAAAAAKPEPPVPASVRPDVRPAQAIAGRAVAVAVAVAADAGAMAPAEGVADAEAAAAEADTAPAPLLLPTPPAAEPFTGLRAALLAGERPTPDLVDLTDIINAFPYGYPETASGQAVLPQVECAPAPFRPGWHLLRIGFRAPGRPSDADAAARVFTVRVVFDPRYVRRHRHPGAAPADIRTAAAAFELNAVLQAGEEFTLLRELELATAEAAPLGQLHVLCADAAAGAAVRLPAAARHADFTAASPAFRAAALAAELALRLGGGMGAEPIPAALPAAARALAAAEPERPAWQELLRLVEAAAGLAAPP